jgi:DnaJ-class molecular chaperone
MVEESISILGMAGMPLTPETVKAAFRTIAKTAHPDVGGSIEQFAAADRARAILEIHLSRTETKGIAQPMVRNDCPNWKGKGRVVVRRHFANLTITCGRCHGTGDADLDIDVQDT